MARRHSKAWRWEESKFSPAQTLAYEITRSGDAEFVTFSITVGRDVVFRANRTDLFALREMLNEVLEDWV